jgi:hypothetical protein
MNRLSTYRKGLRASEITPMLQFFIAGMLCGEAIAVSRIIGNIINTNIAKIPGESYSLMLCAAGLTICIFYAMSRGICFEGKKFFRSRRLDLALIFSAGLGISLQSDGLLNSFYAPLVEKLTFAQCLYVTSIPLGFAFIAMSKAFFNLLKIASNEASAFLDDENISGSEADLLDLGLKVSAFATGVMNKGSSKSLVFGIDSPWGVGKTSFLELCCEYWENLKSNKPIILKFEPLRYEDGADLTQKFLNELINTIQEHTFSPSIRPLLKRYEKLIENKTATSILNIGDTFSHNNDSINSTYNDLAHELEKLKIRVIVIIDDLDRLHWSSIKHILFSIKRSFMLPYTSYILCYDTDKIKITPDQPDSEKTREFIEKFVNISTSLFLNAQDLSNYTSKYFDKIAKPKLILSNEAIKQLQLVIQELTIIFDSKDFRRYTPFIGDIRKIKRVLNTLLLLDIDKLEFDETDFNKRDMLHLVLIFSYYPALFRKIYETETSGKSGFFSLIQQGQFKNSVEYEKYKTEIKNPDKVFLLSQLFDTPNSSIEFTEADFASRAFFQGDRRTLEKYLYLITKQMPPVSSSTLRFYTKKKEQLFQAKDIEKFLNDISDLEILNQEPGQEEFWRIVSKDASSINSDKAKPIIKHLVEKLPTHSLLEDEAFRNFRKTAIRLITTFLDESITSTAKKTNTALSPAEQTIADLVFGTAEEPMEGIINKLVSISNFPLGFYDLLTFRHYCTVKTKREQLWRTLTLRSNNNPSFSNSTDSIKDQRREISQETFKIFKKHYIDREINFFSEIDIIGDAHFFGRYKITHEKNHNTEKWKSKISAVKYEIKREICSQLGGRSNEDIGIYDEVKNNDKAGISNVFSKYLFTVCFNLETPDGHIHFAEYLLTFTDSSWRDADGIEHIPSLRNMLFNLDENQLRKYWLKNRDLIKTKLSEHSDKSVHKPYSTPTFGHDLQPVYRALDDEFIPDATGANKGQTVVEEN